MKKVLYVMGIGNQKMVVGNTPFPGATNTIDQHKADINAWRELPERTMLICHDVQGAANQHAHMLCCNIQEGAEKAVIDGLAIATKRLVEYAEEVQDTEPPGEPHTTH